MKVLCLGDIYGSHGREAVERYILKNSDEYDFIIVNGENAAAGFGITPKIADSLFLAGADVITTGNHIWNKRDILEYLDDNKYILRPANFSDHLPGKGISFVEKNGKKLSVINMQGSVFMQPINPPFNMAEDIVNRAKEYSENVIVDFHAEATSEKMAMGYLLDGKASLVYGTHTHVQTNDAQILDGGTGYCTDIGMCGSHSGVIGVKKEIIVSRFVNAMSTKFISSEGKVMLHGLVVEIENGSCTKIDLLKIKEGDI